MPYFKDNAVLSKSPIHNKINVLRAGIVWTIASIIIFCVLFGGFSASPALGQEARGLTNVTTLKLGDKIPDELWNMPLKVVNHPEGKEYIKLSDYRDKKLIVLDFWGTWCGSCVSAIPGIKKLQNKFEKDIIFIPMANQKADVVESFIAKNDITKQAEFWSVVDRNDLYGAIIKYTLPHFTWISDRKILSNSSLSAIKEENFRAYLDSKDVRWGEKVNLNTKAPFFASIGNLHSSVHSFYYEGDLDGVGSGFSISPFQTGLTNYYFINLSQRKIYEWFMHRIARANGGKMSEIRYDFEDTEEWKIFNERPVSIQIITKSNKPLEDIYNQFRAMTSIQLKGDENGIYTIVVNDKEVSR